MRKIPGMLIIGSTCRNVGKTDLAVRVIRRFQHENIVAVKVTPIFPDRPCPSGEGSCGVCASLTGPYEIERETITEGDKDTQRMLAAGAERAFWVRVKKQDLKEALDKVLQTIGPGRIVVMESCSAREIVEPDLFILVGKAEDCTWKSSAMAVRKYADRFIEAKPGQGAGGTDFGRFTLDEIELSAGRWSMPQRASAIILAGGKSSRMGRDKSLMDVGGRPLISLMVERLRTWFDEVIISSNAPYKYSFLDTRVVVDRQEGQGPLMGMASALEESKTEHNLVLACDIPTVDRALIRRLLLGLKEADVVIPVDGSGRLEPLYAAYRKAVAGKMFQTLMAGRRRIIHAFDGLRVQKVELDRYERLPNLNTPKDWHDWKVGENALHDRL